MNSPTKVKARYKPRERTDDRASQQTIWVSLQMAPSRGRLLHSIVRGFPMSQNRKMLKILSFIQVVAAVVAVVMAVGAANGDPAEGFIGQIPALGACGLHALCGLLTFMSALYGIRGANRPSSLGAHRGISAIAIVAGILAIVLLGTSAGSPVLPAVIAILGVAAVVLDGRVVKEADR